MASRCRDLMRDLEEKVADEDASERAGRGQDALKEPGTQRVGRHDPSPTVGLR